MLFTISAKYLPYFTFLTIFRCSSFALALVVFRYYALIIYGFLIFVIIIVGGLVVVSRNKGEHSSLWQYWKWEAANGGWYYPILLAFRSLFTEGTVFIGMQNFQLLSIFSVNDNKQPRTLFQGFWFLTNLFFIAGLNYLVNLGQGFFFEFFDLKNVSIIQSKTYFNLAIGTVFFSGGLSFVLFVVQIRKKYVSKSEHESDTDSQVMEGGFTLIMQVQI